MRVLIRIIGTPNEDGTVSENIRTPILDVDLEGVVVHPGDEVNVVVRGVVQSVISG